MKKLIIGSLIAATSLFATTTSSNDFFYDKDSGCIINKATKSCAEDTDFFSADETSYGGVDYTGEQSLEFEINGVPGFTIFKNGLNEETGKVFYTLNTGSVNRFVGGDFDWAFVPSIIKTYSSDSTDWLAKNIFPRIDSNYDRIGDCRLDTDCNSALERNISAAGYSTDNFTSNDPYAGYTATTEEGSNENSSVEIPTYTRGESTTYTTGDNEKVDTPLSNGKYISLSKDNTAVITNLVCESGENGFEIIISNTKINKTVSYNSCTDAKIKWTEGSTNTGP